MEITLRKFAESDLATFEKWLKLPQVARWYTDGEAWLAEVQGKEYQWISHFVAICGGKAIGFCQYYEYKRGGEDFHGDINVDGVYSIDYMIGEPQYLMLGLGKAIVVELVKKVFSETDANKIIVKPDEHNLASRKTLLSAGFIYDSKNELYLLSRA